MRFERLIVTSLEMNSKGINLWKCICDCGGVTFTSSSSLTKGNTKSCGCLRSELLTKTYTKHGMTSSRVYQIWLGMRKRCNNEKSSRYKFYGAKGIKVCERWNASFDNFLEDMGEPKEGQSIDRINVYGNYEPNNCRWASSAEQHRNTSKTRNITFNGSTLCLKDWADKLGISCATLAYRLDNWTLEKAFTAKEIV